MAKVLLASANLAQLVSFATVSLGLDIEAKAKEPAVRSMIAATGFAEEEIEVADALAPSVAKKVLTADDVVGRKFVRINIPVQEGVAGGNEAVLVGVNGVIARIMRGVDVDVPAEYVEVLRNAQKQIFQRDENSQIVGSHFAQLYPFSILAILS